MNLKQELEQRNLIYQYTDEKLFDVYEKGGQKLYIGVDPTADSLQLGNLIPIMGAVNFMKRGNKLVLILGGATGMIGDPGGKDSERQLKSIEEIRANGEKIQKQLQNILHRLQDLAGQKLEFEVVNNYDFYKDMNVLDFLRDVGKHITVNQMITKETVKRRIEDPDKSISYTEFSYMLLQGYDYLRLYQDKGVHLQLGGSDQWWNILTWIELIGKALGKSDARGFTVPLLTTSDGKKFGKSEGNAIWLDSSKNSPYFVYQYFVNATDEDVGKFLKVLTLLPLDQIEEILAQHQQAPEERYAQRRLAYEVVRFLFGQESAKIAQKISDLVFYTDSKTNLLKSLDGSQAKAVFEELGGAKIDLPANILDVLVASGLANSKSDARRAIKEGSIFVNDTKVADENFSVSDEHLVGEGLALLRRGKKKFKMLKKA